MECGKKQTIELINNAEHEFRDCWQTLVDLLHGAPSSNTVEKIVRFQPKLGGALIKLEEGYRQIHAEKRSLVSRKSILSPGWFRRRMASLSTYQNAIESTIAVGKSVGDAFAWPFYSREREYLLKHLDRPSSLHVPAGIGGMGELAVVGMVSPFENHFLLHHGITNFLTLGDVSVFDLTNMSLTAVGEIKTRQVSAEQFVSSLTMIGPKRDAAPRPIQFPRKGEVPKVDLPPQAQDRLRRQLHAMSQSFDPSMVPQLPGKAHCETETCFEVLGVLAGELRRSRIACRQAGKHLALLAYRDGRKSLGSRLLRESRTDIKQKMVGVPNVVLGIFDKASEDNALFVDGVHWTLNLRARVIRGVPPFPCWPVDMELRRQVIFHETALMSMFNPAGLTHLLRGAGYSVEMRQQKLAVSRDIGGKKAHIDSFGYFITLLKLGLLTEEAVLEVVEETIAAIKKADVRPYTKVSMNIQLDLGGGGSRGAVATGPPSPVLMEDKK
ncbi:MAG: hypothetical protein ABR915_11630 [Thermoguttaceae bacterium]